MTSHARREEDPWRPSGVVTLLTDFGHLDAYVGVMKGVILSSRPELCCVDLTHEIPPQDVRGASWQLAQAWRFFPRGTVHLAVVDPGVGSSRAILVAEDHGHVFVAPDNGLLGPVLSQEARVHSLDVERFARPDPSHTFHGRDVFSPAVAALAGGLDPRECGAPAESWTRSGWPEVRGAGSQELSVEVVWVDHFGNLITALGTEALEGNNWTVEVGGVEIPLAKTYSDVAPGEHLALIGSCRTLEVSVRDGSAAALLAAGAGSEIRLRRRGR